MLIFIKRDIDDRYSNNEECENFREYRRSIVITLLYTLCRNYSKNSRLVLVLIAVKYISDVVKDPRIFDNVIIAIGAGILGTVIYFSIVIPAIIGSLSLIMMIALIVEWVVFIISGVFARRSCNRIAELRGVVYIEVLKNIHGRAYVVIESQS